MVSKGWRAGQEVVSSEDRDSAGSESGLRTGDGCTIVRMYLLPLNCRLKKVTTAYLIVSCMFYHNNAERTHL